MATIGAALSVVALLLPASTASEIVVTTASDAADTPEGVSLREAIEATNGEPGEHTIRFAAALAGETIVLRDHLPAMTGGGVTIDGAGVTLRSRPGARLKWGLWISSGGNRLRGLTLEGFTHGVLVQPDGLPVRRTDAGTVVSGLVMRDIEGIGIWIVSGLSPSCGAPKPQRCRSFHRWTGTTIRGNTIEAADGGLKVQLNNVGDRFEDADVTGNRIVARDEPGIALETSGDSTGARISDVLIARNAIEGNGVNLIAGSIRGQTGTIEKVRILDNRIHAVRRRGYCCGGIAVQAGSDDPSFTRALRPLRYLDGNVVRDVQVRGNSITGTLTVGVGLGAGGGSGGSRNVIENVRIERNVIRSTTVAGGVSMVAGGGTPYLNRYATRNRITDIDVTGNRITIGRANPLETIDTFLGGVVLAGSGNLGRDNAVRGVGITGNRIAIARAGIKLIGGFEPTARGNSVTCVRLAANRITGTHRAVSVTPNARGASGNRASLRC